MKTNESFKKEHIRPRAPGQDDAVWVGGENHVGEILRRAREEKGISLKDASRDLKIRFALLDDLEQGNFDKLPGHTFAVGFLKLYIRHLGVADEQALVAKFISQMKPQETRLYYEPPPQDSRNRPGPALVVSSLLLFIACFVGYEAYWAERPFVTLEDLRQPFNVFASGTTAKPENKGEGNEDKIYPPAVTERASGRKAETSQPASGKPIEDKSTAKPVGKGSEEKSTSKANETAPPQPSQPAKVDKPAAAEKPVAETPVLTSKKGHDLGPPPEEDDEEGGNRQRTPPSGGGQAALVAREKVWVQIKNSHKQIIKELVLKEGEVFPLNEEYGFLTVGNAGGVHLRWGNKDSGLLGPKGKVMRNVDISAKSVQKRVAANP